MGHHSHLVIAGQEFLACRDGYVPGLAALFTEADRRMTRHAPVDGQGCAEFGYATTVTALRERLQVQGFTAARARADLDEGLRQWHAQPKRSDDDVDPPSDAGQVEHEVRSLFALDLDNCSVEEALRAIDLSVRVGELSWYMSSRSLARLLLDLAPDPQAEWLWRSPPAPFVGQC